MKMSNQDQLKMHSPNLVDANIEKIAALFPNCVTEAQGENGELKKAIDFDLLKQELSQVIVEGEQERYRLDWVGKKESILTANAPIAKTLRPCREESVNFDKTENLFIEGDNLEALKLLQENYLGKVKMIYIDPPYNTGNDFIYEDDFAENTNVFFERSNQIDEEGNKLVAWKETEGRFHSAWLSMMYSRLKLAKNLLTEDGVILVSIGNEELKNLIALLGDVFGESNKVAVLTWEKGRKNDSTFFSDSAEYMILFAKNKNLLAEQGKWRERKEGLDIILEKYNELVADNNNQHDQIEHAMRKFYAELDENDPIKKLAHFYRSDDRGLFFGADISSASTSIPDYEIYHPLTGKPVKKPSRGWGATEPVMLERIKNNEVLFGVDESTIPLKKSYLIEVDSIVKTPVIYKDGRAASSVLKTLFGEVVFNNPKDHEVLADIISYCLQRDKDALILDFFAGSSSTAHAIMELNSKDNGKRKFIVVQIPEILDLSVATPTTRVTIQKAIKLLNQINKPLTIAEISKERIRRAGRKILAENSDKEGIEHLDIGFRVLKIDSTNMKDVYYTPDALKQADILDLADHIKADRSSEDLLFQVMLDWGLELSLPIERKTIAGKEVLYVAGNSLVACFDELTFDVVDEVAKDHPLRFVSAEKAIHLDHDKTNIKERFKQLSPDTEVKFL